MRGKQKAWTGALVGGLTAAVAWWPIHNVEYLGIALATVLGFNGVYWVRNK